MLVLVLVLVIGLLVLTFSLLLLRAPSFARLHVEFLGPEEMAAILKADTDHYFARFTAADLSARRIYSIDEYTTLVTKIASESVHSTDTQAIVRKAIEKIQARLMRCAPLKKHGIDAGLFWAMPWKIAIMNGSRYEDGLPHTRGDVIFISRALVDSEDLARTLFHEQLHVYQKRYPEKVEAYFKKHGFRKSEPVRDAIKRRPLLRANPDTDAWVWKDSKGTDLYVEYRSETPSRITDTLQSPLIEHPYEWMAYGIASKI